MGSRDINTLVLALFTRRFRVPLMWTLWIMEGGNSGTPERIALMDRYLRLFGASSIRTLLADREFVGTEWMQFLNKTMFLLPYGSKRTWLSTSLMARAASSGHFFANQSAETGKAG